MSAAPASGGNRPATLRELISREQLTVGTLVLDPMSAVLARKAGFETLYLGGGALGYLKTVTEANLSLTEMAQLGMEIRSVCPLPLILDGACGWGDPMHMHRTIGMAQAAGFQAIEIEDQILPKRVHHHVGTEHLIPMELMVDKIREAKAAVTDPDFVLIARTNAGREDMDEAVRRAEAMRAAGADMILLFLNSTEKLRFAGERIDAPLMHLIAPGVGFDEMGMTRDELAALGFRLVVDSLSPLLAVHDALQTTYAQLASGKGNPQLGLPRIDAVHDSIDLDLLLEIEKRTVERPA